MTMPTYVQHFCNALSAARPRPIHLSIAQQPIVGRPCLLTTSHPWRIYESLNRLGRHHDYTFRVGKQPVELWMQLYLNDANHWRLFCCCPKGMLLSVNLTLLGRNDRPFPLSQQIRLTARNTSPAGRASRARALCETLRTLDLEVGRDRRLVLGTFNPTAGVFEGTTPEQFIADFALASLVKGHFMGNKGYRVPGLPGVSTDARAA